MCHGCPRKTLSFLQSQILASLSGLGRNRKAHSRLAGVFIGQRWGRMGWAAASSGLLRAGLPWPQHLLLLDQLEGLSGHHGHKL